MKLTISLLFALTAWAHDPKLIEVKPLPSDDQVQYTAGGSFGGSSDFTWKSDSRFRPSRQWVYSAAFLVSAQAVDAISSRGPGFETNPILGRGTFGARQEAIKGGLTGALLATEWIVIRKHPRSAKYFAWANYVNGGITLSAAGHNFSLR